MSNTSAFIQCSCMGYTFILNRFDYNPHEPGTGVGAELLNRGEFEPQIAVIGCKLLAERKQQRGWNGLTLLDGGANIGALTVFWARFMDGASGNPWGRIIAIEPQEWPYYALCGNIAINNCFNVSALRVALGEAAGTAQFPFYHPLVPRNFGGVSIKHKSPEMQQIQLLAIDDLELPRLDVIKLDIEGSEPETVRGTYKTLERCRPYLIAETLNCGEKALRDALPEKYEIVVGGDVNAICAHREDISGDLRAAMDRWKEKKAPVLEIHV